MSEEELENIKQAIVKIAAGCAYMIGEITYFEICESLYPGFEKRCEELNSVAEPRNAVPMEDG